MSCRLSLLGAVVGVVLISGCSSLGNHGSAILSPANATRLNPLDAAIDDHMYFSKEASSGGRSFAGGGCGYN